METLWRYNIAGTYHKIRIDVLDGDTKLLYFFCESACEGCQESFGSRVSSQHGGRNGPGKGPNVQDESALPVYGCKKVGLGCI